MAVSRSSILIYVVIALAIVASIGIVLRSAMTKGESDLGKAFVYDLDEFRKTDPELVKYEEKDKIETGFGDVFAIAVDSRDNIYVAGDSSIKVFGDAKMPEISLSGEPKALTVTEDGTIYVAMQDHVEIYDPNGKRRASWDSYSDDSAFTAIDVYGDDVFVADAANRVVLRYNTSGELISLIGKRDTERNIPGIVVPSPYFDLAVAADGLLRVANPGIQRIEAYTFDGYLELSWGKSSNSIDGFAGCHNPVNFAILPDGRFVTCEIGLPRVKIYGADGTFESVVAGAELFPESENPPIPDDRFDRQTGALDVAHDSKGRILVLDPHAKTIRIFEEV